MSLLLVQCCLLVQSSLLVQASKALSLKETQNVERSCKGSALLHHKLQVERGPDPLIDERTKEVKPMKCGALFFLHLGKTGGSSVVEMLKRSSRSSKYTYFDIWGKTYGYNYSEDEDWRAMLKISASYEPRIVAQLHHGVPGLGCYFWEQELAPLQEKLEAKGCELRLTTVMRNGSARAISAMNYDHQLQALLSGVDFGTNSTPCEVANRSANQQAKTIVEGWCSDAASCAMPAACTHGFSDEQLLQKAKEMLSKMSFVGQTEDLQTFADKLLQVMSLEPGSVALGHDNPTLQKYVANLTQEDLACFSRSNHLDDALLRYLPE